jgi:hypothetical protein
MLLFSNKHAFREEREDERKQEREQLSKRERDYKIEGETERVGGEGVRGREKEQAREKLSEKKRGERERRNQV